MIAQIKMRRGTTAEWAAASPVVLAAGEMGLDTTIQKSKIGDGTTEWASLPWLNGDVTNPNILHNWDFRNPVNQRGVSGAISAAGYFYDRWILNSGTVTTNAAYLNIGAAAEIDQRIEGNLMAGQVTTVSVMVGGVVYSGTGTFPSSAGTASVTVTGWGTATLGYATGYMYVRLSPTAASNVQTVKCELGTVSTLAYDPPMDYGVELTKCERYCQVINKESKQNARLGTGYFYDTNAWMSFLVYKPGMRFSPPTVSVLSGTVSFITTSPSPAHNRDGLLYSTGSTTGAAGSFFSIATDDYGRLMLSTEL